MIEFIINNIGTIIVAAILLLVVALIVIRLIKRTASGGTTCSCGCDDCPSKRNCASATKKEAK